MGFWLLIFPDQGLAQKSQPDSIIAHFIERAIVLDGVLGEAAWQTAVPISNLTQRELQEGSPVTEKTQVAVLYTAKSLYIGIWCFDREADKIVARELKRDFDHSLDDNFEVIIDTYHDRRNGYLFVINPNGAREDAQVFDNGGSVNQNWNGVWNVKTTRTAAGWFAEMEIPFSTLKFRQDAGQQTWGINFERNIRRKREQVLWQGWSRDSELEFVNRAGTLTGLNKLPNRTFVEVKPYGIAGVERQATQSSNGLFNAGGDVNYLITPTLRANLTINPDFAQVESDRQQINLTRFPLFFPERREFFLEGEDYFQMGMGEQIIPFYSRRIGLSPRLETVPILAGARLLGKINKTTLGAMSLQTASRGGGEGGVPSTNYSVLSWRQDVLEQSTVGLMTVNKYAGGRLHSTTGGYLNYSTSAFLGNKNLTVGAAFSQNYNSQAFDQEANAQRLFVSYPNDKVQFDAAWQRSPLAFNPEMGFLHRTNFQEFFTRLQLRPRPQHSLRWIRQFNFQPGELSYFMYDDTGGLQSFSYKVRPLGFWSRSGEALEFNILRQAEGLREPFRLRDDILVPAGTYWQTRYEFQGATFSSRLLSVAALVNWGGFYDGKSTESQLGLQWRTSRHLSVSVNYEKNWINLPQGRFTTDLINNRLEYALSPNVFGAFLTQWNNEDQEMNINYRLQLIPKVGTDFYFIVNQLLDTSAGRWKLSYTVVQGKLIWRLIL